MPSLLPQSGPQSRGPEEWFLVIRGTRVSFASTERCLAEAYYHGQPTGSAVLLAARVLLDPIDQNSRSRAS